MERRPGRTNRVGEGEGGREGGRKGGVQAQRTRARGMAWLEDVYGGRGGFQKELVRSLLLEVRRKGGSKGGGKRTTS
jgi:hypothetical protein